MTKKIKLFILAAFILLLPVFFVNAAMNLQDSFGTYKDGPLNKIAGQAGYQGTDVESNESGILNMIGVVLNYFFSFLGIIFMFLLLYAGFIWMTARGDQAQVTKAKDIMTAAIIGLIIILFSYAISYFIMSKLGASTLK